MPLPAGEHNYLDRETADLTAANLISLFDKTSPDLSHDASDPVIGSPHLIESLDEAPPQEIEPFNGPAEVYAVDGGSSILARGGNIEVMAWRAGMVRFHGPGRIAENCRPPEILAYNRLAGPDIINEYMLNIPLHYIPPKPLARPVDDLRWAMEWCLMKDIIETAEPDTLLLVDGSLRANPSFDIDAQRELMQKAADSRVHVAAITKQSSLTLNGGLPLDIIREHEKNSSDRNDYWYRKLNRPLDEQSGWLGNIYLAALHPGADKPYRIDINRYAGSETEKIFGLIASVSDDVEFCGYPYPLAAAHRLARIDNIFRLAMIENIGQALERGGFSTEIWQYLSGDMHEKLNADIIAREEVNG